jgi:hypothetical protein
MKAAIAFALLVLAALPGAALSATRVPWASAHDIQLAEPGMLPADAACVAHYYRGRLSRDLWFTHWYGLTPAQKLITDAGYRACMTPAQEAATIGRSFAKVVGDHPELACAARALVGESKAARLALDTQAKESGEYDRVFRACRLMGVLYARTASETMLTLTRAEQACANRVGTAEPVMHTKGAVISKAFLKDVGTVFDKCVGTASEEAMYRRVFAKHALPSQITCIARQSAATVTFVELITAAPSVKTDVQNATAACLLGKG